MGDEIRLGHGSGDLYVTTDRLPKTALSHMPPGFEVICTRGGGWELWFHAVDAPTDELLSTRIATELPVPGVHGLKLEVGTTVLCDSLKPKEH